MELKFKVSGHTQLSRNLRIFAKDIRNLREFFEEAISIVEARSDAVFAAQGRNVQKANTWAPLAKSTLKARANRWGYYSRSPNRPGILRWTGNLQDSRARSFSDRFGRLEFTMPYAPYHQDPKAGSPPPRRVIIDLSNPTNAEIVRALQKKIQRDMKIFGRQA